MTSISACAISTYLAEATLESGGKPQERECMPIIEREGRQSRPDRGPYATGITVSDESQWVSMAPLIQMPSATEDTIRSVQTLLNLSPDWDGYGSPPPSKEAADIAFRLVSEVKENFRKPAHVCPVGGGGIQLEWHVGEKDLEIEIESDGSVGYLAVDGQKMQEGELPLDRGALRNLFAWIDA